MPIRMVEGFGITNREELTSQLQDTAMLLDQQIAAEREKFGAELTAEQEQQLQGMNMQARQQLGEMQNQAQAQINEYERELVEDFRGAVAPLAADVARANGANVVLARDAYVFWYEDAIDITDEVIAAWQARPPEAESAEDSGDAAAEAEMSEEEQAETEAMLQELEQLLEEAEMEVEDSEGADTEAAPAAE